MKSRDETFLYLHGFASGPASKKAAYLRERFAERGFELRVPQLDEGDFEHMTITRHLALIGRELDAANGPVTLIGSSMGGYLAALVASRDGRVSRAVLLAPGFFPASRFHARLGDAGIAEWKRTGVLEVPHYIYPGPQRLGFGLYEDFARHDPYPSAPVPMLAIAGTRDETVPPTVVASWARMNPNARVIELDTDHDMVDALPAIWDHTQKLLWP